MGNDKSYRVIQSNFIFTLDAVEKHSRILIRGVILPDLHFMYILCRIKREIIGLVGKNKVICFAHIKFEVPKVEPATCGSQYKRKYWVLAHNY